MPPVFYPFERKQPSVDTLLLLKAVIMGVVEGLTEFLPISSTGHLILTGSLLGMTDERDKVFEVAIQTGAIFAVILVYWQKIRATLCGLGKVESANRLFINILIAFAPAVVLGLAFGKTIKAHLFNPLVVATAFIVGGVIIWAVERRPQAKNPDSGRVRSADDLTAFDALKVGLVQCLAMIPGTSRSGSTIIGGMLLGLSRKAATDFSFFLAIPTLIGAGAYDLYKNRALMTLDYLPVFGVGLLFSFISAYFCVRWLLKYISTHTFTIFAWYRIAFGCVILLTWHMGWVNWVD
jgi:undecaprenyl-diphosphatase